MPKKTLIINDLHKQDETRWYVYVVAWGMVFVLALLIWGFIFAFLVICTLLKG